MSIKELTERFFNGDTTVEEELTLRHMLESEDIPEDIKHNKALMLSLLPKESDAPSELEETLSRLIDKASCKEKEQTKENDKPCKQKGKRTAPIPRTVVWYTLSIVASITLVCMLNSTEQRPKDTFDNPDIAAVHVSEALTQVSMAFSCGMSQTEEVATLLNEVNTTINNHMSNIIFK